MCIFSQPIEIVSDTHIYGRVAGGQQFVAYEMKLASATDTAMVLPVPVLAGSGEEALRFISLESYPKLFEDLDDLFPADLPSAMLMEPPAVAVAAPVLEVHRVGSFEASFVPTVADFSRLDERFRLPAQVWEALPAVHDGGFAVFKLVARDESKIHPMAFVYPTRWPDRVVFPTIHVHDGVVHESAHFDHRLFCQLGDFDSDVALNGHAIESLPKWAQSPAALRTEVDVNRAGELVDGDQRCYRLVMHGTYRNEDVSLDLAPIKVDLELAPDAIAAAKRQLQWNNEACERLEAIRAERGLICPHCGVHSPSFKYVRPPGEERACFVCPKCESLSDAEDLKDQLG